MTHLKRLFRSSVLAVATLATLSAPAFAQGQVFPFRSPSPTGAFLAGQQAFSDLRIDEAARYFRSAVEREWDNALVVERSFLAYAINGEIEQAALAARRLLVHQPRNELARLVIATEAMRQRRYASAANELERLGTGNFVAITGTLLRAWALTGEGRFDQAETLLDRAGENGLEAFFVYHRALMADVAGESDEALDLAARAYEADPLVARMVEAYSRMLGNQGRFDEAREVLARYDAEGLSHPLVTIVEDAVGAGRRPGPFVSNVQAGAAEMFHSVGVALARDGSNDVSILFLQLGRYLDPRSDLLTLLVGQMLDRAGQHDVANRLYEDVAPTSPMRSTATIRVAQNLDSLGDRAGAIDRLREIIAESPDDLDALSVLADLLRIDEQYDEAAEIYTRAIDQVGGDHPADWRFWYLRGIAYERNDQWDLAETDFLRALELNPEQPQVLNYLGYSWVDQGINLEPALEMIERAVAAAPNDGYIIDSLGWAFYRLGRFEEAVVELERAVRIRPMDPEINDHLGDAYWRVGRELEARFQWTIASSVDTEGNVQERVRPKLAGGLDAAPVEEGSEPITVNPVSLELQ
ncbi:tetratricopeptide repeat protein [Arsenicitalea aurantiaca]|uniref:Tetratricopeptide repeat protein n=1 Tax=Arsenicitalea aurantiaca TaxID=1783274 RepID=A0A433XAP4_9HYPH|nr:tetratricopeptide repeat protein [Arsenicitalea aurantiaca]RUT31146.1 tetratricopeptide repeat protein [Arsenicitalea aurantiaca]